MTNTAYHPGLNVLTNFRYRDNYVSSW